MEEHREQLTKKKLQKIYRQLYRQLNEMVSEAYVAYADGEGRLSMAALQEQARLAWFLEEIDKACKEYLPQVGAEVQDLVETAYRQAFAGMSEAFNQGYDLAELGLNPFVAEAALQNDVVKLTLPPLLEKNRNEIAYEIKQVFNIGLMNGERYETMARRLQERLDVSYGKAENIVRTEGHRNTEKGFVDCGEQIQQGLTGSDLIYASTWRTMQDQRVRPQQRRKTKKGWKTSYSKNGANHMKMEGQTVRVGESFDLGGGVKAKAPGLSGVAAQDCRCRCFAEYNLMTVAEFAQATGQSEEKIREKYGIAVDHVDERGIIELTEQEHWAVNEYISSGSYKINEVLREGAQLTKEQESFVRYLDAALEKMPVYEGPLIRSLYFQGDSLEKFLQTHKKGEKVYYPAYTSFSTQGGYGKQDIVRIYIRHASHGRDIRQWNPQEQEVIYERNATFEILDVVEEDGIYRILVEEAI